MSPWNEDGRVYPSVVFLVHRLSGHAECFPDLGPRQARAQGGLYFAELKHLGMGAECDNSAQTGPRIVLRRTG